jgi:hypothetical protein
MPSPLEERRLEAERTRKPISELTPIARNRAGQPVSGGMIPGAVEGLFNTLAGAAKGATQATLGFPGDINELLLEVGSAFPNAPKPYTSKEIGKMLPSAGKSQEAGIGEAAGEFLPLPAIPVGKIAKAAKASVPRALNLAEEFAAQSQPMSLQMNVVPEDKGRKALSAAKKTLDKPRLGTWSGEDTHDIWKAKQEARMAEETAAKRDEGKKQFLEPSEVKQRLYHGTNKDIEEFDPQYIGKNDLGWYGPGHYLTADPATASAYADYEKILATGKLQNEPSGGANVLPVHAQLRNPYYWPEDRPIAKTPEESETIGKQLREQGYDGIIVSNKHQSPEYAGHHEVIVFDPKRIKSAIGNRGTYDVNESDITKADGGAIHMAEGGKVPEAPSNWTDYLSQHAQEESMRLMGGDTALNPMKDGGSVNLDEMIRNAVEKANARNFTSGGASLKNIESKEGLAPYGLRHSGEGAKGKGYFGGMPGKHGMVTELSTESEGIGEHPLIVPTLTREELEYLLAGGDPTESIYKKARQHAEGRKSKGKGSFADPSELRQPKPEYADGGAVNIDDLIQKAITLRNQHA